MNLDIKKKKSCSEARGNVYPVSCTPRPSLKKIDLLSKSNFIENIVISVSVRI